MQLKDLYPENAELVSINPNITPETVVEELMYVESGGQSRVELYRVGNSNKAIHRGSLNWCIGPGYLTRTEFASLAGVVFLWSCSYYLPGLSLS